MDIWMKTTSGQQHWSPKGFDILCKALGQLSWEIRRRKCVKHFAFFGRKLTHTEFHHTDHVLRGLSSTACWAQNQSQYYLHRLSEGRIKCCDWKLIFTDKIKWDLWVTHRFAGGLIYWMSEWVYVYVHGWVNWWRTKLIANSSSTSNWLNSRGQQARHGLEFGKLIK